MRNFRRPRLQCPARMPEAPVNAGMPGAAQIKDGGPYVPDLSDVPETMLWTLNNRASGARGAAPYLEDPWTLRILAQIDYDFEGRFGTPELAHAIRSKVFDEAVAAFLAGAPDGTVVNLGEGIETQRFRMDNGRAGWLSIDTPEAMAFRELFIAPDDRCRHLAQSALELSWCDAVDATRPVFVTAQGLLMYFEPEQVRDLVSGIAARLPGAFLMFDHIPQWMSRKSFKGMPVSKNYMLPRMPWGVDLNEVSPLLRSWVPNLRAVEPVDYMFGNKLIEKVILGVVQSLPILKHKLPGITRLECA